MWTSADDSCTQPLGALVGGYVFPVIEADGGGSSTIRGGQYPFYVASSLCFVSAFLVWLLPKIDQDTIELEDKKFRAYLVSHGWDITKMGNEEWREKRRDSLAAAQELRS